MATIQIPTNRPGTPRGGKIGNPFRSVTGKVPFLIAAIVVLLCIPTMFVYINPGNVGIVIHKLGGGVDRTPLSQGLHFRNPLTTGIEEYPVYMQTLVLTRGTAEGAAGNDEINVNSVEGQPLSLDVSLSFELDPSKTPALYTTFRTHIEQIQHGYVKQSIRQALQEVVGSEPIADVLGPKKAEVVGRTQQLIATRLAPYGFIVKQFTINEVRAPAEVMSAINTKNVMQQQALTAQNELQKNTFNAQGDSIRASGRAKAILAEAQAQAQANQLLSQSITPTLVQYEMAKKWNGQMPQVSGGATPLIQMPSVPR
ncbi:MAG TPA: prohibitin family protein [Longimicrobium sp.]|jgi:regulator of protease activity HflC (stomatin/prohibitin superfamily)